jgi:type IV secretion/conjugal transfer VirB4 family ATPase
MTQKTINNLFNDTANRLWVEDQFPLLEVLDDNITITTKDGQIVQVVKLAGLDYSGLSYQKIDEFSKQRQKFFENVPDEISLTVHYQRKKYKHKVLDRNIGNEYVSTIFEKRAKEFKVIYKTDIYIVISKKTAPFSNILGFSSSNFEAEVAKIEQDAKDLFRVVKQIMSGLNEYHPEILEHVEEDFKEGREVETSPLLGFWSYLINGGDNNAIVPKRRTGLGRSLACNDIEFVGRINKSIMSRLGDYMKILNVEEKAIGKTKSYLQSLLSDGNHQYCIFHNNTTSHYSAFVSIKDFPDKTNAELLNNLMSVKRKFNIVQRVTPVPMLKAQNILEKKSHSIRELSKYGRQKTDDIHTCLEFLTSESHKLLEHDLMICIHGDSVEELDQGVAEILNAFIHVQIVGIREKAHVPSAFWSQFPDNEGLNKARRYMVSSVNVADMVNFSTVGEGNLTCAFGDEPIDYFKTSGGQSYAFTLHPNESKTVAGHTLVLGGTGLGKTVFMNHINVCSRKYPKMKTLILDSFNGMQITAEMLGGIYNTVDKGLELNPMQLADSSDNRSFLERFIAVLAQDDKGKVTEEEKQQIIEAIELNYSSLKQDERSLHAVRTHLGVPAVDDKRPNLISRLQKWLPDAEDVKENRYKYGQFFNADKDSLSFDNPVVGFDFGNILENDELKIPLSMYIFHAFTEALSRDPSPHICFWDETLKFIKDDRMFAFIQKALLEWRKRNGVFVGAVQDPNLLLNFKNGEDFLRSFSTYIIFPDPNAEASVYIGDENFGGMGITDSEFNWIKKTKSKYQVMVKRKGGGSTIMDINLSGLGEHLVLLQSEASLVKSFEESKERYGNKWIEHFIENNGER